MSDAIVSPVFDHIRTPGDPAALHERLRDRTGWIAAMAALVGTEDFLSLNNQLQERYGLAMAHLANEAGEIAELMAR